MDTLKAFYRDVVIAFILIIMGLGVSVVARKGILTGELFMSMLSLFIVSIIIVVPMTIYRLITGNHPQYCDDVLGGLTIILVSAVIVYTGFVLLGTILIL